MNDRDRISPYNIKQLSDENEEKYQSIMRLLVDLNQKSGEMATRGTYQDQDREA